MDHPGHRFLICGAGSVGERHIRNLLALGFSDIHLLRTGTGKLRTIDRDFVVHRSMEAALAARPDVAIICNPSRLHLETALACAEAGCHVLVEKPLADSLDGVDALRQVLARTGKRLMVGYMLRFHPLLATIKGWLDDGLVGQPRFARSVWSEYLPDWHPWEDYRQSYAARRALGGGPALTLNHDVDLMLWLFGKPRRLVAMADAPSALEMDVEPGIDILVAHDSGVQSSLHLDFLGKPPLRHMEIIADNGVVSFDYFAGTATAVTHDGRREAATLPPGWDRNDMFVAELQHFLDGIAGGTAPRPDLDDGVAAMSVSLDALRQAKRI